MMNECFLADNICCGCEMTRLAAKCDYLLFADNLMDLTHELFVHATSIGNKHVAENADDDNTKWAHRDVNAFDAKH